MGQATLRACAAVGFTAVITGHYPQRGTLMTFLALLTESSRLVLGLHYPSDIAIGGLIGGTVGWSSFAHLGCVPPHRSDRARMRVWLPATSIH